MLYICYKGVLPSDANITMATLMVQLPGCTWFHQLAAFSSVSTPDPYTVQSYFSSGFSTLKHQTPAASWRKGTASDVLN